MTERRTRNLFVAALLVQLALLTVQVPDPARRGGYVEAVGLRLLAPLARAVDGGADSLGGLRESFLRRAALVEENHRLLAEVERLGMENMRLQDADDEARRLAAALDYARLSRDAFRAADIVYNDHASWLRALVVRTSAPAQVNQPVVGAHGLVGRVVTVSGPYARVQLITDRASGVGAVLERTRRQGIVRGDGDGGLEMDYVPLQADVQVGDRVITAGIDGIYPRGIVIADVVRVGPDTELFHGIKLQPAVDLGAMGQVYIVDRPPLPAELKEPAPLARR